jgi:hypothetical protein
MPRGADDRRHGRHALLLVGYDVARRVFVVKNSWGSDWGDRGYVYMPFEYVLNRDWTQPGWAIRLTTRDAFDPTEPPPVNLVTLPHAPPEGAGDVQIMAGVANMGAQAAVGAFTGSSLLGGLAGGLLAGLTPGLARVMRGRDRGAFVGRDRSDEILAQLRGTGAPPVAHSQTPWDGVSKPTPAVLPPSPAPPPEAPPAPARPVDYVGRLPARIATFWRENGGRSGSLGAPISEATRMADGNAAGHVVRFEQGAVFAWDATKDAPISAPFALTSSERSFARWVELGAGRSPLGWPLAPPQQMPDGRARLLLCTRGALFDVSASGVYAVFGSVFAFWQAIGGSTSGLGYPLSDQEVPSDPSEAQTASFEHGQLHWSPSRGAWRDGPE